MSKNLWHVWDENMPEDVKDKISQQMKISIKFQLYLFPFMFILVKIRRNSFFKILKLSSKGVSIRFSSSPSCTLHRTSAVSAMRILYGWILPWTHGAPLLWHHILRPSVHNRPLKIVCGYHPFGRRKRSVLPGIFVDFHLKKAIGQVKARCIYKLSRANEFCGVL